MKSLKIVLLLSGIVSVFVMCNKADTFPVSGYDDRLSGGFATVFDVTSQAFTHDVDGLSARDVAVHGFGDQNFEQTFVDDSTIFGGKGPIFNNVSCISCHHNDGKGTPTAGFQNSSLLFRISIPGLDEHGAPLSAPGYGFQIQDKALLGVQPEAHIDIQYKDSIVTYADGSIVSLRVPKYTVQNAYYPLPASYYLSPRLAPPVFGAGLLEDISESTILSFADENDANGDGISGKPNFIFDTITNKPVLGRFGLKANTSSIEKQVAVAYQQDMGVTSYLLPDESSKGQSQYTQTRTKIELPDSTLKAVIFYIRTLAVPARRNVTDSSNVQGARLFTQISCAKCHIQTIQTGVDLTLPQLSNQRIHPYTDLLLHDMGAGLADGRPDFDASGTEWRTAPLWGIGLFPKTNGTPFYLHDGRARSIEEAILWHGGEAQNAKEQYRSLSKNDRDKLLSFLNSL